MCDGEGKEWGLVSYMAFCEEEIHLLQSYPVADLQKAAHPKKVGVSLTPPTHRQRQGKSDGCKEQHKKVQ